MSRLASTWLRPVYWILLLSAVVWAIFSARQAGRARQVAPCDLSEAELQKVRAHMASCDSLRQQFLTISEQAQRRETAGSDVGSVRRLLADVLVASAEGNTARMASLLSLAEHAMDAATIGGQQSDGQADSAEAVARRVRAIEPAFTLGRDLLTEGNGLAERLVAQAARHNAEQQYGEASMLLDLAAQLLRVFSTSANPQLATMPDWFTAMAATPLPNTAPANAKAWIGFCEKVVQAQTLSGPVEFMMQRARRSYDAGDYAATKWWASLVLQSQGISDQAAAAGVRDVEMEGSP